MELDPIGPMVLSVQPDDGRMARRSRNREAVLDAVIELFSEDNLAPDPDEVALRAGVSVRSVYRYFEDREALVRAAIDRQIERVSHLYVIHAIGQGTLRERIDRLVSARLRLYDATVTTARAARLRANVYENIRDSVEMTRRVLREQIDKHFAPELAALDPRPRRATAAAVDVLCQFESIDYFRTHRRLSSTDTQMLLVDSISALFASNLMRNQMTEAADGRTQA